MLGFDFGNFRFYWKNTEVKKVDQTSQLKRFSVKSPYLRSYTFR